MGRLKFFGVTHLEDKLEYFLKTIYIFIKMTPKIVETSFRIYLKPLNKLNNTLTNNTYIYLEKEKNINSIAYLRVKFPFSAGLSII